MTVVRPRITGRARLEQASPTYVTTARRLIFGHLESEGVDPAKLAAARQMRC
jgi:hypothetical protein